MVFKCLHDWLNVFPQMGCNTQLYVNTKSSVLHNSYSERCIIYAYPVGALDYNPAASSFHSAFLKASFPANIYVKISALIF